MRSLIEGSVRDMREDHFEALVAGESKMARWIAMRDQVSIVLAVLAHISFWALVGRVLKMRGAGE